MAASANLDAEMAKHLKAIDYWLEDYKEHPLTRWSPVAGSDTVAATTALSHDTTPELLCIARWLTRQSTNGEVELRHVATMGAGPVMQWLPGAATEQEVAFVDPRSKSPVAIDREFAGRLASLLADARPVNPDQFGDPTVPRRGSFESFLLRMVGALLHIGRGQQL